MPIRKFIPLCGRNGSNVTSTASIKTTPSLKSVTEPGASLTTTTITAVESLSLNSKDDNNLNTNRNVYNCSSYSKNIKYNENATFLKNNNININKICNNDEMLQSSTTTSSISLSSCSSAPFVIKKKIKNDIKSNDVPIENDSSYKNTINSSTSLFITGDNFNQDSRLKTEGLSVLPTPPTLKQPLPSSSASSPILSSSLLSSKKNMKSDNNKGNNGNSMTQQLSTSWEFIKLEKERPIHDFGSCSDEKDEPQDLTPPRYIKISDGKISLVPPKLPTPPSLSYEVNKDQEVLEARILELEEALSRLQEKFNNSQSNSPTLEKQKDLMEQLEIMNKVMKSKEKKAVQAMRVQKILQAQFTRQENFLLLMQQENKTLQQRIRQYEYCLDDVMRKVVDALVAEDSLREEVAMLKSRVRDLEAQNAALCAKGRDEGYCTMSIPQLSSNHLEDLPEEPEQWLITNGGDCDSTIDGNNICGVNITSIIDTGEPSCSADMEDWSMSQEELGNITLGDDPIDREIDWIWNSSGFLNSTMIDSQSDEISKLLQETIVYSEDEEITCIDFTKDFYKLVNIPAGSTKSLYSYTDIDTDDNDVDGEGDGDGDGDDVEDKINLNNDNNFKQFNYCLKNVHHHHDKSNKKSSTLIEIGQEQVASGSSISSDTSSSTEQTNKSFIQSIECTNEKTKILSKIKISGITNTNTKTETSNTGAKIKAQEKNKILNENDKNENFDCSTNNTNKSAKISVTVNPNAVGSAKINVSNKYSSSWQRSNGWKRLGTQTKKQNFSDHLKQKQFKSSIPAATSTGTGIPLAITQSSKKPPPVPIRRSYAS